MSWKKLIFIRHLLRRRRHLYRNVFWCPHLSGDIKVFGVGTYSSPSFTLSKWKKIPYQTLTKECMSSYAGMVPPFSVIRPLHSFPLSSVRWLWRVMCCEMFMQPAVQVHEAWRRISAACELKREIPLIFHTQTHFLSTAVYTKHSQKAIHKKPKRFILLSFR